MNTSSVTSKRAHNHLTIYINGIPHLKFGLEHFVCFQSWQWLKPQAVFTKNLVNYPSYNIELYFDNANSIPLEYDNPELWKEILKHLDIS